MKESRTALSEVVALGDKVGLALTMAPSGRDLVTDFLVVVGELSADLECESPLPVVSAMTTPF